jgi:hypothetical protein
MTNYPTPWVVYTGSEKGVYGDEAKCYEHAVFFKGEQVGNSATGHPGYTGHRTNEFSQYGLVRKFRQKKEYVPRAKRAPEQKVMRSVRIETYDKDGELTDLTVETRMVYTNGKGDYIKTRSNGNPRITYYNTEGQAVIEYRPIQQRIRAFDPNMPDRIRWVTKPVAPR